VIYFLLTDFFVHDYKRWPGIRKEGTGNSLVWIAFSKTKYHCMEKQFKIRFNFPLEHSLHTIALKASVTLHHSEPYYVVEAFRFADAENNQRSLLPPMHLKYVKKKDGKTVWVHKDSERESELSIAIGTAIEAHPDFTGE
jgi:hypothetical protein